MMFPRLLRRCQVCAGLPGPCFTCGRGWPYRCAQCSKPTKGYALCWTCYNGSPPRNPYPGFIALLALGALLLAALYFGSAALASDSDADARCVVVAGGPCVDVETPGAAARWCNWFTERPWMLGTVSDSQLDDAYSFCRQQPQPGTSFDES